MTESSERIILVVEAQAEHRALLQRVLSAAGYAVVAVASETEALGQAQQQPPDLVLLDLHLPGQRGWQLGQQLRANSRLTCTPILGTTLYAPLVGPANARAACCVDCLEKPFDTDYLLYRIERLLPQLPCSA